MTQLKQTWSAICRLAENPVLRTTGNNVSVCNFKVVTEHTFHSPEGSKTVNHFHAVTVWGAEARRTSQHLQKGSLVQITGIVAPRTYTDRYGVTHQSYEIQPSDILWLNDLRTAETATVPLGVKEAEQ